MQSRIASFSFACQLAHTHACPYIHTHVAKSHFCHKWPLSLLHFLCNKRCIDSSLHFGFSSVAADRSTVRFRKPSLNADISIYLQTCQFVCTKQATVQITELRHLMAGRWVGGSVGRSIGHSVQNLLHVFQLNLHLIIVVDWISTNCQHMYE